MGAPKVSTVGGGRATNTANSFNDWLTAGLKTGQFGDMGGGSITQNLKQIGGFSDTVNQLLSGKGGQQAGNPWFANAMNGGTGGLGSNLPQVTNQYQHQMPQFQNTNLQQLNTQAPAWQQAQFQNINTAMPNGVGGASGLVNAQDAVRQYLSQGGQMSGIDLSGLQTGNPAASIGRTNTTGNIDFTYQQDPRLATNVDSSYAQAVRGVLERNQQKDVAELRSRFGAGGGMSLGTGASYAEGNLRAENTNRIGQALGEINMQEQNIDLANRGLWQQGRQNAQAMMSQDQLARLGIQSGERGQDVSAAIGAMANANQAILGRGNMQLNANNQAGQLALGAANAQNNAMLENQGLINNSMLSQQANANNAINAWNAQQGNYNTAMNQYGLNAAEFGNNAMYNMNAQNLAQNQNMNAFNLSNAQSNAQFGQNAQMANASNMLQDQQLKNNFGLGQAGIGAQLQQLAQSGQLGILSQLFGAYGQANGLGTAQAETLVQPNGWQQAAQIGLPIAGAAVGSFFGQPGLGAAAGQQLGNSFGGGTQQLSQLPQYRGLQTYGGGGLGFGSSGMSMAGPNIFAGQGASPYGGSPFAMGGGNNGAYRYGNSGSPGQSPLFQNYNFGLGGR